MKQKHRSQLRKLVKGSSSMAVRPQGIGILSLLCLAACTPSIHDVVASGDRAKLEAMLGERPALVGDLNALDKTPLHYAVSYKNMAAMELLVAHGADLDAADATGMTPLHVAAMFGRKEEAAWLLAHGAALEPRDAFGDTPVHTAAIFHGGLIGLLHQQGAALGIQNEAGLTPLEAARHYRNGKAASYIEKLLGAAQQ